MTDATKKVHDALLVAANKLADTMFIYGTTTVEVDDKGGIFATVEDFDGLPKRVYLFGEEATERATPNYFKRALGEAKDQ